MTRSSLYVISIKNKNYITKIDVFFMTCVKYSYNKNYHSIAQKHAVLDMYSISINKLCSCRQFKRVHAVAQVWDESNFYFDIR